MEKYNKRVWLNPEDSHFTGSVVFHDGVVSNQGRPAERYTFMEVASCHAKVRIHTDLNFTLNEYIDKLKLMRDEIDKFIEHLER
jgi:hypothetical protein